MADTRAFVGVSGWITPIRRAVNRPANEYPPCCSFRLTRLSQSFPGTSKLLSDTGGKLVEVLSGIESIRLPAFLV